MFTSIVTEGVTLSVEVSETTYQMLLEELAGHQEISFDGAADKAIAAWVLSRRNHRRLAAKLMVEAA